MPNYTIEQITDIMSKPELIRNMSVIAHVDHGKSTLTDSLVAKAGIISILKAGDQRFTDNRPDEAERGITIKSTGVSLYYEYDVKGDGVKQPILINLIDSPGHVDFSSEVTAALRVTDGALVVVDFVEGVCVQTETVLRQALQEKIRPVLMVNKIDRGIHELMLDSESMYQRYIKIIESANVIISTYTSEDMPDNQVVAEKGTVAFGAGLIGYAFTISQFARIYSKKFGVDKAKMMEKLWGDNYYDSEAKKWKYENKAENGKTLKRAFCSFIMDPIIKLSKSVSENKPEIYNKMLEAVGLKLTAEEQNATGRLLMRTVFQKWILAADALIEMVVEHLPSPKVAQKYRGPYLYEGPVTDECCKGIMECNPQAPLMVYISKMIPTGDKGRFYAFGRVFSGTATAGLKCKIMGPNYIKGKKEDLFEKPIQRVCIMMGKNVESVNGIPCGNTCGLVGIDQYLVKTGTISSDENASTIRVMKYSVSPVVRVAVQAKNPADLPKLVEGLKKMMKSDPLVQITTEENGQSVIAGSGELHVEICIKDLVDDYAKVEIIQSEPVVSYRETVSAKSQFQVLTKSQNKHNRIWATAEPIKEDLVKAIEAEEVGPKSDPKLRIRAFTDKYGWEQDDAKKVWCFGPENIGPNVIVDQTKSVQFLNEIKDSLITSFQGISKYGILCEENLRGVRVNIMDVALHPDAIHRGGNQILPQALRLFKAAELSAQPRMQEPIYAVDITCPTDAIGGVYTALSTKRGQVINELPMQGTPLTLVKSFLPVAESFGFTSHLRSLTSGQAFPQCVFDHWETVILDPLDETTKIYAIVEAIKKRKSLKPGVPKIDDYIDKL